MKIDYVLISHFDTDHCGGILTIMEKVKVKNIIISEQAEHSENYERFKKLMIHKKIRLIEVKKGDILKVAHHGSKTSSIPEFIKAVKPKIALIGVGKNNTFGHPNKQTIKNLENIKCRIYRTDIQGEIIIKIDQKGRMNVKSKLKIK